MSRDTTDVKTDPALWRSFEEWSGGGLGAQGASEEPGAAGPTGPDRRSLMRWMAASLALAGLPACDDRAGEAGAPLFSQPRNSPGHDAGNPLVFATSLPFAGCGVGVLAVNRDGRTVKIEGNPAHSASLGAAGPIQQAAILGLHDPDRSRAPVIGGAHVGPAEAEAALRDLRRRASARSGAGLHVVLPVLASRTRARVEAALEEALPGITLHRVASHPAGAGRRAAQRLFGRPADGVPDFAQADAVLSVGGDPFGEAPGHLRHARDWIARRHGRERAPPVLIACESRFSLFGIRADRRHALPPRLLPRFLEDVLAHLDGGAGEGMLGAAEAARLLAEAGPRGLVLAGEEQEERTHALALAVMARIGAIGRTWRAVAPLSPSPTPLAALAEDLAAGRVEDLMILGCNPVHGAPGDLALGDLVARVPHSLHLGLHNDESARLCRIHLPQAHALESWGDLLAFDGTAGLCQPAMVPRWPVWTVEEVLTRLFAQPLDGRAITQAVWREAWGEAFDTLWPAALEEGVVQGSAAPALSLPAPDMAFLRGTGEASPAPAPGHLTALFAQDPHIRDAGDVNNGWLQELPRPVTKETWGNAALIAPETARRLALGSGDVVAFSRGEASVEIPVLIAPGHAVDCVTLTLGYGRTAAGRIGDGIGVDVSPLLPADGSWTTPLTQARATGARRPPILTQHHHAMEGRDIVRVLAPGEALPPIVPPPSLYPDRPPAAQEWAMAIDLDACIGCNACVVACQAENNVPVVGPAEVEKGREMHWLRIDRYFAGDPAAPDILFQPVPCMHCEKAPCEIVCPVNATVHSAEGLNEMVYNRCIGTRTCSNNCPYKVRRFNFLAYRDSEVAPPAAAANPQVTTRERGVMEKCTYCIQRIWTARIDAEIAGEPLAADAVVTACQQACPTRAISFGDKAREDSTVAARRADPRAYALLGELGTRPRTTYLARVRGGET